MFVLKLFSPPAWLGILTSQLLSLVEAPVPNSTRQSFTRFLCWAVPGTSPATSCRPQTSAWRPQGSLWTLASVLHLFAASQGIRRQCFEPIDLLLEGRVCVLAPALRYFRTGSMPILSSKPSCCGVFPLLRVMMVQQVH